ncbi:Rhamnulokinase [Klebsiella pneumoniae]|uniref:Rhamnulokinase n=1 Tax=Klebsiella pneumoniae TaxID=573 RepID=A0A377WDK5_KLEPN|nr:Rhamnulokinase [Klebsiella pneumoniae]
MLKEQNISDLQGLIARTAALPACRFIIDCNDDRFINPASMSAEIQAACRDAGQPVPESDAELARCIFDSLALLYARVLNELAALRGHPSASCISSAAAVRTRCSTSCALTPAGSPSWPAR